VASYLAEERGKKDAYSKPTDGKRFLVLSREIISMNVSHGVENIVTNPLIFSIKIV